MATVYGPLVGDPSINQLYTTATPEYGFYPNNLQLNILGPVIAPRIYGKDLTVFEIASSGSVDVTLNDTRSLVLQRGATGVTIGNADVADSLIIDSSRSINVQAGDNLSLITDTGSITLTSESNMTATAADNVTITATAGLIQLQGANFNLAATGSTVFLAGSHAFQTSGGVDVMTIDTNTNIVTVHGNLNVTGVINSVTVTESTLEVADKNIILAHNTDVNGTVTDGAANTAAGIVVAGMPTAITDQSSASNIKAFEKSLRWYNSAGGIGHLGGDSNVWTSESYWELRGGSLRITNNKPSNDWTVDGVVNETDDTSYVFRINNQKALEIVKYTEGGGFEAVARFGASVF